MSLARGGDTLRWRGVAPKALLSPASDAGDVNNHSFTEDTCGYYSVFVQWNDDELSDHTGAGTSNNVWTWATANNGSTWTQYGSQIGYYSMLCNNKNAIKVGAIQKLLPLKAAFSSMGPTRDGRIGPDVMAPGAGFSSNWYVEVDSVALVNGSTKKVWHFSDGDPQWSADWLIENPQQSGGQLTFAVRSGGYLWSNSIYPATTVVSSTSDTLVIRYRLNLRDTTYGGYTVSGDSMVHRLMWKRPSDTYAKDDDPWHFVQFMGDRNGWVNRRIWLGDPSLPIGAGGWVNGDTIERIRIEFIGWREKNDAVVSCVANANDYAPGDGTSMACPHVTGIA